MTYTASSAETDAERAELHAYLAQQNQPSLLESHIARPRYRPAFTRVLRHAGAIVGYALLSQRRLRLGAATLEAGQIDSLALSDAAHSPAAFATLLGDCLQVMQQEALALSLVTGAAAKYTPFGFAAYRLNTATEYDRRADLSHNGLRPVRADDLDDLAALYDSSYQQLPLSEMRTVPDWRQWLIGSQQALALEDSRGRLIAYAQANPAHSISEAAADAGAARQLLAALLANDRALHLALPLPHLLVQAAIHSGASVQINAAHEPDQALAGVVDLPGMLEALAPEFDTRLARSRYAGWSGNIRIEIDTERITLAFDHGRATMIDGSRPADLRLRQVTLPALAQLCLGYRTAADLRATGGLRCDDSALGLIDALFPAV